MRKETVSYATRAIFDDMKKKLAVFALVLTIPFALFADRNEISEFLELAGARAAVAAYPQLFDLYIQYNPNLAIPINMGDNRDEAGRLMYSMIHERDYFELLVDTFAGYYDSKRAASYRRWAETELGSRIVAMEAEASNEAAAYNVLAYQQTLNQNPPTASRSAIIERIAELAGSGAAATELINQIEAGVFDGLTRGIAPGIYVKKPAPAVSQDILDESVLLSYHYAYREASDQELEAYLSFLEERDTRWFLDSLDMAQKSLVRETAAAIASAAAPYFESAAIRINERFDTLPFKEVVNEGDGWRVEFPGAVTEQSEDITSEYGTVPIRYSFVAIEDLGSTFYVSVSNYPESLFQDKTDEEIFASSIEGMLGYENVLTDKSQLRVGNAYGYNVVASAMNGMMQFRCYVLLNRKDLMQALFYGPAYLLDHPAVERFFASYEPF